MPPRLTPMCWFTSCPSAFFFCTGTVLVGFDRCRIDAQVFKIGFDVKGLEDGDKESGVSPFAETTVGRFP
ncbi:hypothetical protein MKY14_13710 [Paenibacillus sp. FSL R5-0887]|uniref:hypothetical protein n=1 Tax=Paenibacillus sp. FSL R5-0887 TaxID=2921662 RepID=UPI0030F91AE4